MQQRGVLQGDTADVVAALRQDHDKALVIIGSAALAQTLLRCDLIDAFVLPMHSLVLGTGRRLLPEDGPPTKLSHANACPHYRRRQPPRE